MVCSTALNTVRKDTVTHFVLSYSIYGSKVLEAKCRGTIIYPYYQVVRNKAHITESLPNIHVTLLPVLWSVHEKANMRI
jgi:hypothetical protein